MNAFPIHGIYDKILFGWESNVIKIKVVQVGGRHFRVSFLYDFIQ